MTKIPQIEFVQNKDTKEPFDPDLHVNWELHEKGKLA